MRKIIGILISFVILFLAGSHGDVIAQGEPLDVVLRDESFRKLLIKDGSVYKAEDEIYIELPKDIFESSKVYEIKIQSVEKESGERMDYQFYYQLEIQ